MKWWRVVAKEERVVIGADFNGHGGERNRDKEVMGRYGGKERNVEGQMVVDFAKRMEMAESDEYIFKREGGTHRWTISYAGGAI